MTENNGGDAIQKYEVQYKLSDVENWNDEFRETRNTAFEFLNLENAKSYDFRVRARNSYCEGPWSLKKSVATGNLPNTPTGVLTEFVDMNGDEFTTDPYVCSDTEEFKDTRLIKLSWEMGQEDSGTTGYTIKFENSEREMVEYQDVCDGTDDDVISTKSCTFPMSTFWKGELERPLTWLIVVQVTATNIHGDSAPSSKNTSGVTVEEVPSKIETFDAQKASLTNDITLSWQGLASPFYNGDSAILSYGIDYFTLDDDDIRPENDDIEWIELDGTTCEDWMPVDLNKNINTHVNIPADTNIHYRIRAKNVWGWGPYSDEIIESSPRKSDAPVLALIDPTQVIVVG
jgi:hypothetical protein